MEESKEELLELTEQLCKFKTVKGNKQEMKKCLDFIEDYYSDSDFVTRRYESENKESLVVSFTDTKSPEVLLHGHIDVVEADEETFALEREGEKLYGRGTADMKSGVASMMKLMKEFREEKPDIALMIVTDEEIGGFNGIGHLLNEENYRADFAISAEPNKTEGNLDIGIKQKGVLQLKITAEGRSGHGSAPWKGENAAEKLIDKYQNEIKPLFPDPEKRTWDTTCNLGIIEAGEATNQIPGEAMMKLDIRCSNEYPSKEVLEDIKAVEGVEVEEVLLNEPMVDNEKQNPYIQKLKTAAEEATEEKVELTKKEWGSDVRFLTSKNIPGVVFGPKGYNWHAPDEYLDTSKLKAFHNSLRKFIQKVKKEKT